MTETAEHTYEFGYSRNSYFQGHDGRVTRDDGKAITINTRDGRMAVEVKDHNSSYTLTDLPEDVQRMAEDLRKHGGPEDAFGRDHVDRLYEQERESWWMSASDTAKDHGFSDVYSDGRSGGWCVIEGTQELAEDFPSIPIEEAILSAVSECGCDEIQGQYDRRNRFLALAFALQDEITFYRTEVFAETIRIEHAELERRREACLIRGND